MYLFSSVTFANQTFDTSTYEALIDTGGWRVNGPDYMVDAYYALLGLGPNPEQFDCALATNFPSKLY